MQKTKLGGLAASVVVTVALAPACKEPRGPEGCYPPDCHMNPPGIERPVPPTTATAETTATATATPTASAVPTAVIATSASAAVTSQPSLPKAPPGSYVQRVGDNCYAQLEPHCPPYDPKHPITCNPPAPLPVACPDK